MDLSFPLFDRDAEIVALPSDFAVLLVGIAARQAASPTAAIQAGAGRAPRDPLLFAPADGAFHGAMASVIAGWGGV